VMHGATDATTPKKQTKTAATPTSTTKSKSSTHRKATTPAGKPASKKTTTKSTTSKKSKTASKHGKGSKSTTAASWRSRQLAPTPERYKEIQSALVQRGYLKKDASGVWDADSADALRRFQQDQSLDATGKLNSLSLIALGLGPKKTAAAPAATPHTPEPQTPAPAPPATMPAAPVPDPPAPSPAGPVAPTQL